jgi:hypothetical protein
VLANRLGVARLLQLRETVAEVADAGNDEFLRAMLYQQLSIGAYTHRGGMLYLSRGYIGGCLDPFYRVADFLDGVDQRADIAGDIVE